MSEMVLLTRDRICLGGFLCLSGLFCQRPVVYPTTFSADTTASTYDSDDAFFFLFHFLPFILFFFLYFLVFLKRCCNHAHLCFKISSYLVACHNVHRFVASSFFCSAFYYLQISYFTMFFMAELKLKVLILIQLQLLCEIISTISYQWFIF